MTRDRFFVYDPEGDGFSTYHSIEARDAAAKEAVSSYLEESWNDDVVGVAAGEITHVATEVDRADRPSDDELDGDGCDEEGTHWAPEHDHMCNYEMLPISKQ